jgi:hypothetical protein
MLDLASLDGERFEQLVVAIFRAKCLPTPRGHADAGESTPPTVIAVSPSGRGADQGLDLLVTTAVNDGVALRQFKWVVQCKHFAQSGKSVQTKDFQNDSSFRDIVSQHVADGYLLVCSTIASVNLQKRFDALTEQRDNPYIFVIWDGARVCEELNRHPDVLKLFFPDYYSRFHQKPIDRTDIMAWAKETGATKETLSNFELALEQVVSKDQADPGEGTEE